MKPTHFIGSSLADLKTFPLDVLKDVGFALHQAENGEKSHHATPLVGFNGAGVLEIVSNSDGNTYRAVYTVRLSEAVFVLHCFQKKSKAGIATPAKEIELVRKRLVDAVRVNEELRRRRLQENVQDEKPSG
jgi:phage-related protein